MPLPDGVYLNEFLATLRNLSWNAADILKAYARGTQPPFGFPKSLKIDNSAKGPVSSADLAVNSWLLDGLSSKFREVNWVLISEESVTKRPNKRNDELSDWAWLIDPLDGTKDFLQGTGDYAMHMGLLYKGVPVFGIVLIPEADELWIGGKGLGAWCEGSNGVRKNFAFGNRQELSELILISSRNHRDNKLEKLFDGIELGDKKIKGSVGCKIVSILKGEADFYVSISGETSPKDWDMAAPEAILISAGGCFTHENGERLLYNSDDFSQKGCLVASSGKTHKAICKLIQERLLK